MPEFARDRQSSSGFARVRQGSPEFVGVTTTGHKAVALQTTLKTELREQCKIPNNKHWRLSAQSKVRTRAGLERLERDSRKDSMQSKRERGQKFKTGARRSDERLAADLLETRKDLRGIPRGDQDKEAVKEIGKKIWRRRRFYEKEIRTVPACARHRSRNGPFHKQEDARGQSKPVLCERLADGDDEVLQQSVRRS